MGGKRKVEGCVLYNLSLTPPPQSCPGQIGSEGSGRRRRTFCISRLCAHFPPNPRTRKTAGGQTKGGGGCSVLPAPPHRPHATGANQVGAKRKVEGYVPTTCVCSRPRARAQTKWGASERRRGFTAYYSAPSLGGANQMGGCRKATGYVP